MALDLFRLATLEAALARLAPEGTAVICTDPGSEMAEGEIFAVEAAAMARAVPARRREFFAGRHAAHRAMAALGHLPAPIPMGPDRAPIWPEGMVGSISHCEGACVAFVGEAARFAALGLDIEPDAPLPGELVPMICLPQERARLALLPVSDRGQAARMIFAAKEAAYKLQYGRTGKRMDFGDVEIVPDLENGRFDAQFDGPWDGESGTCRLSGRCGREAGFMFCMMSEVQDHERK